MRWFPLSRCSNDVDHFSSVCVSAELRAEDWVAQRPGEAPDVSARCREAPAGEDDSDTELTYGEVEQRLDLLQQHLNRC